MVCIQCGAAVADGVDLCGNCGKSTAGSASPAGNRVPRGFFGYFTRHLNGDLPLRTSFWINGIGVSLVRSGLDLFLQNQVKDWAGSNQQMFFADVALLLVNVVIVWWQLVGIWRSAARQRASSEGSRSVSAQIVRILVVVYGIVFGLSLLGSAGNLAVLYTR